MKTTAIGIDLAKEVFQIDGGGEHGKALLRKQLKRKDMAILCEPGTLFDRHESLRQRALLGEKAWRVRAHGQADGTAVREAVYKDEQERRWRMQKRYAKRWVGPTYALCR